MNLDKKITLAEQTFGHYEVANHALDQRVINTKFSLSVKHRSALDFIRRMASLFLPKDLHFAQTNPESIGKRLLKYASQKKTTPEQQKRLYALYEKIKQFALEELQTSPAPTPTVIEKRFKNLDQKWNSLHLTPHNLPAKDEGYILRVGNLTYRVKKLYTPEEKQLRDKLAKTFSIPTNAFEWSVKASTPPADGLPKDTLEPFEVLNVLFQLSDRNLLRPYVSKNDPSTGYTCANINLLFSIYFNREDCVCIPPSGDPLGNKSAKNRIAYTPTLFASYTPQHVHDQIKANLEQELQKNPNDRPQKIFLPLDWNKNNHGHVTLLVIEPSQTIEKAARITMINTHGDSLNLYRDFEHAALKAAQEVYSSSQTTAIRNTRCIYTTATSCGPDLVGLAVDLMNQPNVQETVKAGLPRKSHQDDLRNREKYGDATYEYLKPFIKD